MPKLEHFSTGFTETRVFLGIKKKRPALMDTDTKQMSLSKDCTDAHAFLCTTVQSGEKKWSSNSHLSCRSRQRLTRYIYHCHGGPCAEKVDFFPQKLNSSRLTPTATPTSLLLPFPSFRLSAVKGNNQTPNIHHSSHSAAETEKKSEKFIWLMPLELLQAAYKTQYSVIYAGKYYRTITAQPLLI